MQRTKIPVLWYRTGEYTKKISNCAELRMYATLFQMNTPTHQTRLSREDYLLFSVLLAVTLIFRLWTVMMIHTGIDERDYWYSAKAISQGAAIEYPYINHRTVRWGVIVPVAVQQLITGVSPNAYYTMPILNALVQTLLLYLLGRKLFGKKTAVLATLCLIFFPYQIRAASQVRPEIFSLTYILAMVYFFSGYVFGTDARKQIRSLMLSALMLFFAYQAKITNLFFMPGMFVLIFLQKPQKKIPHSILFGAIPLAGFILETLIYRIFFGYRFGHLEIISANHLGGMDALGSFLEIFNRYAPEYLQAYWQIPFVVFAVLTVWTLIRNRDTRLILLIVPALSFFFFITFTVSSINPLKMAEPFINRYFSAVLPLVFLVLMQYAVTGMERIAVFAKVRAVGSKYCTLILGGGALLFMIVFSLPVVPRGIRKYIVPPFSSDHPFALNREYREILNQAWAEGTPIVACDGNAGRDALGTAAWYYLDASGFNNASAPHPVSTEEPAGLEQQIASLDGVSLEQKDSVVAVIRRPFRVKTLRVDALNALEPESFPGDD